MCAFMGKAPAKPTACPCLLLPPHGDPPHPFRPRGCDSALLVLWNCAAAPEKEGWTSLWLWVWGIMLWSAISFQHLSQILIPLNAREFLQFTFQGGSALVDVRLQVSPAASLLPGRPTTGDARMAEHFLCLKTQNCSAPQEAAQLLRLLWVDGLSAVLF